MKSTPSTFIPDEDQGVVMGVIQLPASALVKSFLPEIARVPGLKNNMGVEGYSFMGGAGENMGLFVAVCEDWSLRENPELSQAAIIDKINTIARDFTEASIFGFAMPALPGLGVSSGINMKLQVTGNFEPKTS